MPGQKRLTVLPVPIPTYWERGNLEPHWMSRGSAGPRVCASTLLRQGCPRNSIYFYRRGKNTSVPLPKWWSCFFLCSINNFQQTREHFVCSEGNLAGCSSQEGEKHGKQPNRRVAASFTPIPVIKFCVCIHLALMVFSSSAIWAYFVCCYITERIIIIIFIFIIIFCMGMIQQSCCIPLITGIVKLFWTVCN